MWIYAAWKLRRMLQRYRNDKNIEKILHTDWNCDSDLQTLFNDIEKRLHGDEITRLQQKQAG